MNSNFKEIKLVFELERPYSHFINPISDLKFKSIQLPDNS
jgi:hypothetical protein